MHDGRGEYHSQEAILHIESKLARALETLTQDLNAEEVNIPPDTTWETCGWSFQDGPRLLSNCTPAELKSVAKRLFRRCQVLQERVDKMNSVNALTLMR